MTGSSVRHGDDPQKSRKYPGSSATTLGVGPLDRRRELADFLTRRRAGLSPSDVGLPATTGRRRRTPGLRREELASLAGVSVDWYIRLEQGRAERPSPSVLDALSGALRLSDDERHHLYALARAERPPLNSTPDERADATLLRVLHALPDTVPAMLLGRRWDLLAWNDALCDLLVPLDTYPAERRNLIELTFLYSSYQERYADWPAVAEETVANFRASVGRYLDLPEVQDLVAHLTHASPEFARWWAQHHVREKSSGIKQFRMPDGVVPLRYDTLLSPSSTDQRLVTYTGEHRHQRPQGDDVVGT